MVSGLDTGTYIYLLGKAVGTIHSSIYQALAFKSDYKPKKEEERLPLITVVLGEIQSGSCRLDDDRYLHKWL
jgi:hypothetical protein